MFLVIYEAQVAPRVFKAEPQIYDDWQAADARAKQSAKDRKCRAWVAEVSDPPILELATAGEVVKFGK